MKIVRICFIIQLLILSTCVLHSQNIKPYAQITDFWVEDDVSDGDQMGLNLHLVIDIYNHGGFKAYARFLFYLEDGTMLRDYNGEYVTFDGQVTVEQTFRPKTAEESYEIIVFMPYDELHVKGAKANLKCLGLIYDYNDEQVAISDYLTFFVDGSK